MAGKPEEGTELGGEEEEEEEEEGRLVGDEADAKPDRRGRFLLFGT